MNKGIDVEIIKDSTNWTGHRLTTYILKYPRYIHSELMTHRVFSKNSASSRAIPINKMIENIKADMVQPIWTLNQAGMQGKIVDDSLISGPAIGNWIVALDTAIHFVNQLVDLGIHKQNVNRLLEPWMHIKIILTGTDFDNFFELRNHKDAQPEIQELAKKMLKAREESIPIYLKPGEWHIPFSGYNIINLNSNEKVFGIEEDLKISVARCARISYNNVDGSTSTREKDIELFDKLITSEPLHASPAEHQARVPYPEDYIAGYMNTQYRFDNIKYYGPLDKIKSENREGSYYGINEKEVIMTTVKGKYLSNLQGWIQYRKILEEQKYGKRTDNK